MTDVVAMDRPPGLDAEPWQEQLTQALEYGPADPLRRNGVRSYFHHALEVFLARQNGTPPPGPLSIQLEVTNDCSTRCAMCFRYLPSPEKKQQTYLSVEEAVRLCNEAYALGTRTVVFSGGEPTTRGDDLIAMLAGAKSSGLAVGVLTNGMSLPGSMIEALVTSCSWVRVSVDAGSAAAYEVIRGTRRGFAKVIQTLEHLVAARDRLRQPCRIGASMTIQRANVDDIEPFLSMGQGMGLDRLDLKFVHGLKAPVLSREQLDELATKLRAWEASGKFPNAGLSWALWQLDTNIAGVASGLPAQRLYEQTKAQCFAPYLTMVVSPFGDVYPCCHLFEDNEGYWQAAEQRRLKYRVGSIRERTLSDIWYSDFIGFRQEATTIPWKNACGSCGRCSRYSPHNVPLSRLHSVWTKACAELGTENAQSIFASYAAQREDEPAVFM